MATIVKLTRKVDGKTETFESDNPELTTNLLAQGWVADSKVIAKAEAEAVKAAEQPAKK